MADPRVEPTLRRSAALHRSHAFTASNTRIVNLDHMHNDSGLLALASGCGIVPNT